MTPILGEGRDRYRVMHGLLTGLVREFVRDRVIVCEGNRFLEALIREKNVGYAGDV